jgi:hypothetical protein
MANDMFDVKQKPRNLLRGLCYIEFVITTYRLA